jgi:hypothetical protein
MLTLQLTYELPSQHIINKLNYGYNYYYLNYNSVCYIIISL